MIQRLGIAMRGRTLRKKFKLLNHDLEFVLHRMPSFIVDVEVHADSLVADRGDSGGENMLCNYFSYGIRSSTPAGLVRYSSRLPVDPISERSRGSLKPDGIGGNGVGLDYILSVFVLRFTPAADFDVHLAGRSEVIEGEHSENGGGFQMRDVLDYKSVRTIS